MAKLKVQVVVMAKSQEGWQLLTLLTNRARGHFWQNVTGSVKKGEKLEHAALRELKEETGLEHCDFRPLDYQFSYLDRWQHQIEEFAFLALSEKIFDVKIDPKEHSDFKWLLASDVRKRHFRFESNYLALQRALEELNEGP